MLQRRCFSLESMGLLDRLREDWKRRRYWLPRDASRGSDAAQVRIWRGATRRPFRIEMAQGVKGRALTRVRPAWAQVNADA